MWITDVITGITDVMTALIGGITQTAVKSFQGLFLVVDGTTGAVTGLSDIGFAVVLGIGIAMTLSALYLVLKQFRLRSKR